MTLPTSETVMPGVAQECGAGHDGRSRSCARRSAAPVMIDVRVRRFFCGSTDCAAPTSAEQIPGVTQPWVRRTAMLAGSSGRRGPVYPATAGTRDRGSADR